MNKRIPIIDLRYIEKHGHPSQPKPKKEVDKVTVIAFSICAFCLLVVAISSILIFGPLLGLGALAYVLGRAR